jgi:hypothetical protein
MKFGNRTLRKVEKVCVGDTMVFDTVSANYKVDAVEATPIGMIRHQHKGGSSSYWPGELVYVEDRQ